MLHEINIFIFSTEVWCRERERECVWEREKKKENNIVGACLNELDYFVLFVSKLWFASAQREREMETTETLEVCYLRKLLYSM